MCRFPLKFLVREEEQEIAHTRPLRWLHFGLKWQPEATGHVLSNWTDAMVPMLT